MLWCDGFSSSCDAAVQVVHYDNPWSNKVNYFSTPIMILLLPFQLARPFPNETLEEAYGVSTNSRAQTVSNDVTHLTLSCYLVRPGISILLQVHQEHPSPRPSTNSALRAVPQHHLGSKSTPLSQLPMSPIALVAPHL